MLNEELFHASLVVNNIGFILGCTLLPCQPSLPLSDCKLFHQLHHLLLRGTGIQETSQRSLQNMKKI